VNKLNNDLITKINNCVKEIKEALYYESVFGEIGELVENVPKLIKIIEEQQKEIDQLKKDKEKIYEIFADI
jgi:hypothetical protein